MRATARIFFSHLYRRFIHSNRSFGEVDIVPGQRTQLTRAQPTVKQEHVYPSQAVNVLAGRTLSCRFLNDEPPLFLCKECNTGIILALIFGQSDALTGIVRRRCFDAVIT